jgi:threonine/homoserine/homoserine lactone efflux protein
VLSSGNKAADGMQKALMLSFTLGFVTASPVGPIGLLCLRRTLTRGVRTGLASALGISVGYAFWSYVAIHGLVTISHWVEQEQRLLQGAIGLFFLLYGVHGIFNTPDTSYHAMQRKGRAAEFLSTFLVVFLNPATFIMFSALFALFGTAESYFGLAESLEIALSVFAGATACWVLITQIIQRASGSVRDSMYRSLSQKSAYAIMLFGLVILAYRLCDSL